MNNWLIINVFSNKLLLHITIAASGFNFGHTLESREEIRIVSIIYEVNIRWLGTTRVQTSAAIINLHTICVQSIPSIWGHNKYLKPHHADITLILLLHKWQRCPVRLP